MKTISKFNKLRLLFGLFSLILLSTGLIVIIDKQTSDLTKLVASFGIQIGCAFFFALSVGYILDKIRDAEGFSVLWLLSQEFRKAGVMAFYANRLNHAEKALEEAFDSHHSGDVLMAGASLRLFLAPGLHFHSYVERMLTRKSGDSIKVKALSCNPEGNYELPIRSFVEEFNQDFSTPKSSSFDLNKKINKPFNKFEQEFFENHGIGTAKRCRVIHDLLSTEQGVRAFRGALEISSNQIEHRVFNSAPYCTVIIFPDRAFYTPNLLCTEVPVNMPMTVFHKTSDAYKKLANYVEFLWWVSDGPQSSEVHILDGHLEPDDDLKLKKRGLEKCQ